MGADNIVTVTVADKEPERADPAVHPTPSATLTDPGGLPINGIATSGNMLAVTEGYASFFSLGGPADCPCISIWNITTKKTIATLSDYNYEEFDSVAFSPNGKTLATVEGQGAGGIGGDLIDLWDIATGKIITTFDPSLTVNELGGIDSVAISPNGKILATAGTSGNTYLWDIATGKVAATLTDPSSYATSTTGLALITTVAFSPSGTALATGDSNGNTYLWDVTTGNRTETLTDPGSQGVDSVAFSPSGTALATGDSNGNAYLWDVTTGNRTETLPDPSARTQDGTTQITSVSFAPDRRTLAMADSNGNTYLWNIATKKVIATLTGTLAAFGPGGATLASASGGGHIDLWQVWKYQGQSRTESHG